MHFGAEAVYTIQYAVRVVNRQFLLPLSSKTSAIVVSPMRMRVALFPVP
jgi:hypothetical protein